MNSQVTDPDGGIDLTCLVETNEGTVVKKQPNMGRVVVATRLIDITGTKLIRERPSLVWSENNWLEFLHKFQSCSSSLQGAVLDMFHPPLDSDLLLPDRVKAHQLASFGTIQDIDLIHKLLAIVKTNGHQYYGIPDVSYTETFGFPGMHATELCALFIYASKVAHSCIPNTAYTSKTQDGCLEYKLIRPIPDGEMVTFSYLDKLFVTPTHIRREKLLKSKSFLCKCQRCIGPDFCRLIHCPTSGCNDCMACVDPGDGGVTRWSCPNCGELDQNQVLTQTQKEKAIQDELNALKMQAMFGVSRGSITTAKALAKKASVQLSPVHYLVISATEHCATLCASLAAQMSAQGPAFRKGLLSLRLEAAELGFAFVSASECAAVGCNGKECSVHDVEAHDPLYECSSEMFFACQDLMQAPPNEWPTYAPLMVERYLPNMRICFGEEDADVREIEQKVVNYNVAESPPMSKPQAASHRSGKRNRKKNRGKK
mmetsp:Transcript_8801/g.15950  ORF Transcript_8801/g.15950 Transcript_8801/m.15950 type:complete len:484 (+) Transcript_8801:1385-2836(+)